jgi:hypothetical protein
MLRIVGAGIGLWWFITSLVILSSPGRIDICDGQIRYELARNLHDHGDMIIHDPSVEWLVFRGRDGQRRTPVRLPIALLGVCAIELADVTGSVSESRREVFFSWISATLTGFTALGFYTFFLRRQHSLRSSLTWSVGGIACTPIWYYGTSCFDESLGTCLAVWIMVLSLWQPGNFNVFRMLLMSMLLLFTMNAKPTWAIFLLPAWASQFRADTSWFKRGLFGLPLMLGVVAGWWLEQVHFSHEFPPDAREDFEFQVSNLYVQIWTRNPIPGWLGLFLSPGCGMIWYCPAVILMILGCHAYFRDTQAKWLYRSIIVAAVFFYLFLGFITFFKGDLCWGPRYLTPWFAVGWLFLPHSANQIPRPTRKFLIRCSCIVQILALSVDPHRLYVQREASPSITAVLPWLNFNPALSHLVQRPGEIIEILSSKYGPATEFNFSNRPTSMPHLLFPYDPNDLIVPQRHSRVMELGRPLLDRYHTMQTFRPWPISYRWLYQQENRDQIPPGMMPFHYLPMLLFWLSCMGLSLLGIWICCRLSREALPNV